MTVSYAILADIVGSRSLADRPGAQRALLDVLARASQGLDLLREPYATVGDEFQALAPTLRGALLLTLRAQLLLPQGLELRFGIGQGEARTVSDGSDGAAAPIQDGPAWWRAREAVDAAHEAQQRTGFVRTRAVLDDAEGSAVLNAMLVLRDQAVARLQERPRRMLAALLGGATQVEAAAQEGVSQSAVSSVVRGSGAGLLEAQRLLETAVGARRKEVGA
ncbi:MULTISPECIES: SatD family protein [unclassified Actinomyces]|uniref:SatD family protein n=1 Tax=unclassified Actinomyces TaxID=2609248 RepID=UPI002016E562|nr:MULTISPECIES: SatD family protein [unclassified Actinomyces]MCL3777538.1 hypothetical protein [Actinomyces sp. AC-20-1]MCL3790635.1 hypothetical protein [Actinomyces sp. 187325]MCL3792926.1 hypothetical protein [Actinomyces sp. 186855]MCL3795371.1 hypothetical protein [Actinomyces sp. 217892]